MGYNFSLVLAGSTYNSFTTTHDFLAMTVDMETAASPSSIFEKAETICVALGVALVMVAQAHLVYKIGFRRSILCLF